MKRLLILCSCFLLMATAAFSQAYQLSDPVSSKNFNAEKYSGIRGTPFLVDKWMKGTVTTPKGVYKNLDLKYNVYDNGIFFNKDDETFELQDNIISFTLMPKSDDPATHMVYRKGITGPDFRDNQFVQVMTEGNASVYKLDEKKVSEMSEINAGMVKTFTNNAKYYIANKNKEVIFVKLNKAEILAALKDNQDKLNAYISDKKLSFRKDADLVELVKYYNTL
jgi:predicted small secreted protein